jgi:signal transduction histidine kinase
MEINKSRQIDYPVLFESIPGLFLILLPDLKIVAVSDGYLEVTMTERKEMIGQNFPEVFSNNPDDKSRLRDSLNIVLKKGIPHTMETREYTIRESDGSLERKIYRPLNKPVFNSDLEISYIIHYLEDITQFICIEDLRIRISEMESEIYKQSEEILKVNTDLIGEIDERIKIEKALEKNLIQLEAVNKELEAFAYSVSHDLRAPLRAIDGYTKILSEDYYYSFDERGRKTTDTIIRNAKKMEHLIEDLLAFSRLGKIDLIRTQTDMNLLVHSVIDDLKNNDPDNHHEIKIQDLEPAFINKNTMKQVWINLIGNALKYSDKKEKTIIQIGSYKKGDDQVYFIRDNGIGFDMQYAHNLFGIFQRLHKMDEFEGTGLGLAIIKRIILRHGGKVWAEGKPNEGATFYFSIPMQNEDII